MPLKRIVLQPLRPGIVNPRHWRPIGSKGSPVQGWARLRRRILERDKYTCLACRHSARKWMMVHHLGRGDDHAPRNLATLCVACHSVLHLGLSMMFGALEVWASPLKQSTIVRRTRAGVAKGMTLQEINATFRLTPGPYPPHSMFHVRELLLRVGHRHRNSLSPPLIAVFVRFERWQLDLPTEPSNGCSEPTSDFRRRAARAFCWIRLRLSLSVRQLMRFRVTCK